MRKIIVTILFGVSTAVLYAQTPTLQNARDELYKINKVFDSSRYLGFDIQIRYSSDTVYGQYEHEEISGNYILNDRYLYYKMGNIEYIQNDSFSYSLYHDEKMMMMTRDSITSKSSLFPLKEFVDSVIYWYSSLYTINLTDTDDNRLLEFTATDSVAPYKRLAIYYEPESHYPDSIQLYFTDYAATGSSTSSVDWPSKKFITMVFSNYRNIESLSIFEDSNYVFFDRLHRQYQPTEKYRNYQFITNGVNEEDGTVELYPPADNQ